MKRRRKTTEDELAAHREHREKQHKATKLEHYRRVRSVQEKMIEGHNLDDIKASIQQLWSIGERQASKYIRKAFDQFKEQSTDDVEQLKAFHKAARMSLLKYAMSNNKKFAHKILMDLAKLDGLYPYKVDVTSGGKAIPGVMVLLPENFRDGDDKTTTGVPG